MKRILSCSFVLSLCLLLALPAVAGAAEKLPPGFIAVSDSTLNWSDAKAFCQQHGGKLPLINGSASLAWGSISSGAAIDGFGAKGAPWPSGLPGDNYWTGTEDAGDPGDSWIVHDHDGNVYVNSLHQSGDVGRVVCVP